MKSPFFPGISLFPRAAAVLLSGMVAVQAAAPLSGDPVDCVNPLSGTNGDAEFSRGNTLAAIVAPFGMNTWAPQTDGNASPFYQMKHERFEGIRASHQPSIWIRDYGDFLITPVVGPWRGSPGDRASEFSHDRETARPYHYSVDLERYDTTLELTPTERCALLRFTFPKTGDASVVFHLEGGFEADPGQRKVRGKATHVTFGAPGGFGNYFVAEFDRPFASTEIVKEDKTVTGAVHFDGVTKSGPVLMRIGTSFISYEQAERNLLNEVPGFDFEVAKTKARDAWARELSRVTIRGASEDQKATFYTALYRALQFPRMFHEPDAEGKLRHYSPFDGGRIHEGPLYTDNGVWDTYRAAFPFFALYYPEHGKQILEGWLNAYREGGRLPSWPSPGNRPCMIGSHSDSIFADALAKGLNDFNLDEVWAATRKNAYENDPHGFAGRDHLDEYISHGYMPVDKRDSAASSCTLEYAYDDWCVAQVAKAAGKKDEHAKLMSRAKNYRNVWDAKSGFMRGRLSDGSWQEPFDPLAWGGAWVEGNAWQWLWSVQHDPYGLMKLLGGREAMAAKLDAFMTMPSNATVGGYGHLIHEMREVEYAGMGQYAHVNEPDHHVLYFYNYLRQPWKTQGYVRQVMDKLYDKHGMIGDEDTGQMSAWYIFNATGLYPFCPGSPNYLIGSPLFAETTLNPGNERAFTIRAKNQAPENRYIQSATFDGKPFTRTWLSHETIARGGVLEFVMGPNPNEGWGSSEADAPPDSFE